MEIANLKSLVSIEPIIGSVINLKNGKGLCPFHDDKHPSLSIKDERFKCFACGEGGDVVDFVKLYYGLDTKEAIKYLADQASIKWGDLTLTESVAAAKARKERETRRAAVAAFREWEQGAVDEIAAILRAYRHMRAIRMTFTEAELEVLARLQGNIDVLEYQHEILCGRDDREKFELHKENMGL